MNHLNRQTDRPTKSEQSVEVPLNRYLSSISIVKSSARFFAILVALVAVIGCGDGITGQVGGVGQDAVIWGTNGSGDGEFSNPFGVAVASDGNIYVADTDNNRIEKFTSDGVFVSERGTFGTNDEEFNFPYGVAVASDGSVYVTEVDNHRIQKFTSEGVFVSQWGTQGSDDGEFYYPIGVAVASDGSVYVADSENHRIQQFSVGQ